MSVLFSSFSWNFVSFFDDMEKIRETKNLSLNVYIGFFFLDYEAKTSN